MELEKTSHSHIYNYTCIVLCLKFLVSELYEKFIKTTEDPKYQSAYITKGITKIDTIWKHIFAGKILLSAEVTVLSNYKQKMLG